MIVFGWEIGVWRTNSTLGLLISNSGKIDHGSYNCYIMSLLKFQLSFAIDFFNLDCTLAHL